jgi:prepilin-type N-terminal cleavage/methylation domain-containing protein
MNRKSLKPTTGSSGFSLLELLIAMSITLAVLVAASTLLVSSLRIRTRENTRSEALAATQRALNILSREIANSGYGLADNGIIAADSGVGSIRIRANLDNDTTLNEPDEDVRYVFQGVPNNVIVRFDNFVAPPGNVVVLANNITNLTFKYYDLNGAQTTDYTTVERIRMDVTVDLPAGPQQPASVVHLQSDIALRNAKNTLEQF